MRLLKIIIVVLLTIVVAGTFSGCELARPTSQARRPSDQLSEKEHPWNAVYAPAEQSSSYPIVITSLGQSTDAAMISVLCNRAGLEYTLDMSLMPAGLGLETKLLLLVLGGGSKCLRDSDTSVADETARARGLVLSARRMSIPVVAMHIGGVIRRDPCSDRIARDVSPLVDHLIVVTEGNRDGLFSRLARINNIPLDLVTDIEASVGCLGVTWVRPDPLVLVK